MTSRNITDALAEAMSCTEQTQIRVAESRFDTMYRLSYDESTRTIWVDGEIDADFGDWFRKLLWNFERASLEPITVWLNTPGGNVQSMFQFYDAVVGSPCEITIIGHGEIISAGVLMFVAGDFRLVTENCVLMSHEGADFEASGLNYSEMKERKRYWDWTMSRWNELMARHTPQDAAYWKSTTSRKAEYWLLGGRAIVEAGIADAIYEPAGSLSLRYPAAPVVAEEVE